MPGSACDQCRHAQNVSELYASLQDGRHAADDFIGCDDVEGGWTVPEMPAAERDQLEKGEELTLWTWDHEHVLGHDIGGDLVMVPRLTRRVELVRLVRTRCDKRNECDACRQTFADWQLRAPEGFYQDAIRKGDTCPQGLCPECGGNCYRVEQPALVGEVGPLHCQIAPEDAP